MENPENLSNPIPQTMSHFTTIQTQIRDLEALADASHEMGFVFLENAQCRG